MTVSKRKNEDDLSALERWFQVTFILSLVQACERGALRLGDGDRTCILWQALERPMPENTTVLSKEKNNRPSVGQSKTGAPTDLRLSFPYQRPVAQRLGPNTVDLSTVWPSQADDRSEQWGRP